LGYNPGVDVRFCDEWEGGFGWIHPHPAWVQRASHALVADGRVWVIDPTAGDGVVERIRALGRPAAVVQLLDRHRRDCAAVARRLAVPHLSVPDRLPGSPFEVVPLYGRRFWREAALWWPEARVLVCADALGTAPYYLAGAERLATNPVLRLTPPRANLAGFEPSRILVGHGSGIAGADAPFHLKAALTTARRRAPRWLASYLGMVSRG
jgi:hypothetical protein